MDDQAKERKLPLTFENIYFEPLQATSALMSFRF